MNTLNQDFLQILKELYKDIKMVEEVASENLHNLTYYFKCNIKFLNMNFEYKIILEPNMSTKFSQIVNLMVPYNDSKSELLHSIEIVKSDSLYYEINKLFIEKIKTNGFYSEIKDSNEKYKLVGQNDFDMGGFREFVNQYKKVKTIKSEL